MLPGSCSNPRQGTYSGILETGGATAFFGFEMSDLATFGDLHLHVVNFCLFFFFWGGGVERFWQGLF